MRSRHFRRPEAVSVTNLPTKAIYPFYQINYHSINILSKSQDFKALHFKALNHIILYSALYCKFKLYFHHFFCDSSLIDQIILKFGQVLIRQDQTSPVKSTSIIDQTVINRREHIHIQFCKIQIQQFHSSLIGLIKILTFTLRDCVSPCPVMLLLFLISI